MQIDIRATLQNAGIAFDNKHVKSVLRSAAAEVASATRTLLRKQGSGQPYRFGGRVIKASAPGQTPAQRSGALCQSIRVSNKGLCFIIKATTPYALILEHGAVRGTKGIKQKNHKKRPAGFDMTSLSMKPRPFLTTVMAARAGGIEARIKAAVLQGTKYRRLTAKELRAGK